MTSQAARSVSATTSSTSPPRQLRMLHVIQTLDPQSGGPAGAIRQIVMQFPSIGGTGEVVCMDNPNAPFLQGLDFAVHPLGPISTKYGYNRKLLPWLRAHLGDFDGIVVHGLWQYHGFAVRIAAKAAQKPYAVFTHGMLDPWFKRAFPLKHIKKWLYWVPGEYRVLRDARRVLFTSQTEMDSARRSFWLRRWNGQVVAYGASAPQQSPEHYRAIFHEQFPSLQGRRFLLFLGRIHPKKGCDLLLDAFAKVAAADPDLDLVFAGPDQTGWQAKLTAQAAAAGVAHRVHWLGMAYGEMKWAAFYSCEAFILPSHQENFGISVAEALACSKPVLISNQVNIWEPILEDGAALVADDTAEGTLDLLRRWISLSPEDRALMGRNALRCFQTRYDMRENAKAIVRLFSNIAAEQG